MTSDEFYKKTLECWISFKKIDDIMWLLVEIASGRPFKESDIWKEVVEK